MMNGAEIKNKLFQSPEIFKRYLSDSPNDY